ncbi:unnamed protein product [Coffea canephora]|uniref:Protein DETOXIFICATION n=1 Tax=Coffea canephora TaxID=49390 RepID=A0A068U5E0_COFCA|nr:unnamed protein product [Coffea canephora]
MDEKNISHGLECPLVPVSSGVQGSSTKHSDFLAEVKKLLALAGPLILVNFLIFALQVIALMFVGHLGELALSGASLATSFASVTGFSLFNGMSGALDTFCGQSYGAKHYRMLGIHMQRAMVVLLLTCIPLTCIWANTGRILAFVGQDPEISFEAEVYARFLIPGIFAVALLYCQIRFLQAQNNVFPMMLTTGIITLVHLLMCWLLVFKSGLGSRGAALASSVSYWINVLLLALYIRLSPSCKMTWTGFSKEAFHHIWKFLTLAIPSAIMTCLEIWSFEMMVLLSGLLPNPKLETPVLSISLNTCSMIYVMPLGLGGAISTRVSNELGAGRPYEARLAACIGLLVVLTEGVLASTCLILLRKVWGYCYSTEEKVVRYVADMMLLLAGSHILEGIQTVLSGTARGCGWQRVGAIINLGAYYLLGIPSAILLAFVYHVGGKGLWIGIIVALAAQTSLLGIITVRMNWEKEAKKAADRVSGTVNPREAS